VRNSYLFVDFFFVLSGFVIAWNYAARRGSIRGKASGLQVSGRKLRLIRACKGACAIA
jgi:peptidoglycan/LPS O-acetylase OafA/YrhL